MERDLIVAELRPGTRARYLYAVEGFAAYFDRSPEVLGRKEVCEFLAHLVADRRLKAVTIAGYRAAIDFLYRFTLERPEVVDNLPRSRRSKQPPGRALTHTELVRVFEHAPGAFAETVFVTAYAAGLRISEVCRLRVVDIRSADGLIEVCDAKGGLDRVVMLGTSLLEELRAHWRRFGPPGPWIFPARRSPAPADGPSWSSEPVSTQTVGEWFRAAVHAGDIRGRVTFHALRRSFATHMLDQKQDIRIIQVALGHANISTTERYALVGPDLMARTTSPFERLLIHRR